MSKDPATRQRTLQQREVQRRLFAAQTAAITNMQDVLAGLQSRLAALRERHAEMLPLFIEHPKDPTE